MGRADKVDFVHFVYFGGSSMCSHSTIHVITKFVQRKTLESKIN